MTAVLPAVQPRTVVTVRDELAAATRRAFVAESAGRRRDPHHFGISSLGRCRRAGAYALSRTPVSDPDLPVKEGRAANLGTWEHAGLLPRLAAEVGGQHEVPVTLRAFGLTIPGSIDLDTPDSVVDLKTVGEFRLSGVLRDEAAYPDHRLQAGGYALARLQAGRPPRYVGFHYLDRANGDEAIIVEPFTNAYAEEVLDRVEELAEMAAEPDDAPRDGTGPGFSFECDECPWLRRCFGPDATPGNPRVLQVFTEPEIEAALADYDAARVQESAGKAAKKLALARVGNAPHGAYGKYVYNHQKDTTPEDPHAAARKLKSLGLEVPRTHKRGAVSIKLKPTTTPGVTS
jgi:hypothetical protein